VSTDEVYGSLGLEDPAFTEKTPYDPSSPYSASKASSDHLVRAYGRTFGLPITISNCSNNYGPRQFPEKLIPLMIQNAMANLPLPVYGDGKQRRDWLYVDDHSDAILRILDAGTPGETYNVGGDAEMENISIIKAVCDLVDTRLPQEGPSRFERLPKTVADRPGHDRRYAIDHSKITERLGWTPTHGFKDGIEKTVAWYLENPQWLELVKARGSMSEWQKKNYEAR
jgi:dTDP-glucose 4,6-dehydratase